VRARVARYEVRANIFARVWILVAAGFEVRARVARCEVRAGRYKSQGARWEVRVVRYEVRANTLTRV
jgi:hypothetical protein